MNEPLRITKGDLNTPEVDQFVEMQAYLSRDTSFDDERSWIVRVIYANWFYLSIASLCGALLGWALIEPSIDDFSDDEEANAALLLVFPMIAGCVGLFLGAAEGLICRNPLRAIKSGFVGLGVGFLGGLVALIPAAFIFGFASLASLSIDDGLDPNGMPTGVAFLVLMMGRAAAWAVAGIPAGLGQGIALREKKVIINGVVGGCLGGLVGGLLFDPISLVLTAEDGQATYSRAVGFGSIGLFVGLFVGLVEGWTKTAWLQMLKGPLAGKQFILFKDTTSLGSSPKADIYLFKDDAIEPRHAQIVNRGGRFELEDNESPDGTYVNGVPVRRHVLRDGDQVVLGKTVLQFSLKANPD
ncbi:FHA domain-containing protein [Botrimarina mediterranea]|uniref:FHA domain-containing protein n=1 Tax=Botrimarina mediterranea TaxID=2528022 RepID=UPI00118C41F7|nr:Glycogen accumulation regulator GarA [Planctomycetes bacterium K2D]